MFFKGHNIPGYANFELDMLAEVVTFSQKNKIKIKREHKKLSSFYKQHPDLLIESLHETRDQLEEKKECGMLTEFEELSLKEIHNMLNNHISVDDMFHFNEDFYLDDYKKVFRQIAKKEISMLTANRIVDIIYYDINSYDEPNIQKGDYFSDGNINTGSQIILKIMKVDHKDMISKYQTLFN